MLAAKQKRLGKRAGYRRPLPFVAMDVRQLIGLSRGLDHTIYRAQRQQWNKGPQTHVDRYLRRPVRRQALQRFECSFVKTYRLAMSRPIRRLV